MSVDLSVYEGKTFSYSLTYDLGRWKYNGLVHNGKPYSNEGIVTDRDPPIVNLHAINPRYLTQEGMSERDPSPFEKRLIEALKEGRTEVDIQISLAGKLPPG